MARKVASNTKNEIIEAGLQLMQENGYNCTGIDAVLKMVNVPKGSFYYYFSSKDDFGLSILDKYYADFQIKLARTLNNKDLPPLERIQQYFLEGLASVESRKCRKGCLLGNLSQEMADHNEAFRLKLETFFDFW